MFFLTKAIEAGELVGPIANVLVAVIGCISTIYTVKKQCETEQKRQDSIRREQ